MKNTNWILKGAVAGSGKTNYEVEMKAGLPLTKLSRIIHGVAQPSEPEKEAITKALGKSVEDVSLLFPSTPDPVAA